MWTAALPQPAAVEPALPEDELVEAGEADEDDEVEDDDEESFALEPPSPEALWAALAAWRLSVR